jgi:uncharacterized protein (TIGR02246 family)
MRNLLFVLALVPGMLGAQASAPAGRAGIEAFNRALESATRHMDNAATLALWDDDGTSLLPSAKPLVGKKAIAQFLDDVMKQIVGGRMERFEMECFDIQISGDWASEWCTEHQTVLLPGKPTFDGWGKMLFVLHRGADGKWRIREEMWNQALPRDSVAR